MKPSRRSTGLWSLALSLFVPSWFYFVGYGAMVPVVALHARALGASVAEAGFMVALIGLGRVLGDLPAGSLTVRLGETRAMVGGVLVTIATLLSVVWFDSLAVLAVSSTVLGMALAVWALARHAYVAEEVDPGLRARAFSTLGGIQRSGFLFGPLAAAPVISRIGTIGAYWVFLGTATAAAVILMVATRGEPARNPAPGEPVSLARVLASHRVVLGTLGTACLLVGAARAARLVALPLWAEAIGLSAAQVSVIVGISGAAELLTFYPGGLLMDRCGRMFVAVPAMALMGLVCFLLPVTSSFAAVTTLGVLAGLGNGLSSGLVTTLGVDVSPAAGRAQFLAAWRLLSDGGEILGPAIISGVTASLSLSAGIIVMGTCTWLGGWALVKAYGRVRPRPLQRPR